MNNSELGQSITAAVRALLLVQKDVMTLVISLKSIMEQRGWVAIKEILPKAKHISVDLYILFVPAGSKKNKKLPIGILVSLDLDTPKSINQPYLLIGVAGFGLGVEPDEVWEPWCSEGSLNVLSRVINSSEPLSLSPELRPNYVPAAQKAFAFAVPLCDLTGIAELERCVIDPALNLTKQVTSK